MNMRSQKYIVETKIHLKEIKKVFLSVGLRKFLKKHPLDLIFLMPLSMWKQLKEKRFIESVINPLVEEIYSKYSALFNLIFDFEYLYVICNVM